PGDHEHAEHPAPNPHAPRVPGDRSRRNEVARHGLCQVRNLRRFAFGGTGPDDMRSMPMRVPFAALVLLALCRTAALAVCGDGVPDGSEQCDTGIANGT